MKYNLNYNVTIYPNEKGWEKIRELLKKAYPYRHFSIDQFMKNRTTDDGGYRDQLWVIIQDLHDMFYNGQNYFKAIIDLEEVERIEI